MRNDQAAFPTLEDEPLTLREMLMVVRSSFSKQARADELKSADELKRQWGRQNPELLLALAHRALTKAGLTYSQAAAAMLRFSPTIKALLPYRKNAADDEKRIIWTRKRFGRRKGDAGEIYNEFSKLLSACTDDEATIAAAAALLALDDAISPAKAP